MHQLSGLRGIALACLAAATVSTTALAAPVTVKFWIHDYPPRLSLDQEIITAFESANPDIHIDYEAIPFAELAPKMLTSFAAGTGPDLFNLLSTGLGQYVNSKFVAPLDLEALGFKSTADARATYGVGLDGAMFGDTAFGIPTEVSNFVCTANNELWKAAGLDPAKDAPKTWEDMVGVAEKLTIRDANGIPTQRGYDFGWGGAIYLWLTFNPMVTQLGGQLVDETTYTAHIDSPEVAKVMQYWADWANKEKLGGPQYTASRDAFLAKELATDCTFGIWGIPQFKTSQIDYTMFPVPRWNGAVSDNGFDAYYFFLMVNAGSSSDVQKAAWKFAKFYNSYGTRLFAEAGLFTTAPEVLASDAVKNEPAVAFFLRELETAKISPRIAGFDEIGDMLVAGRDRVLNGEDVNLVLSDLQVQVTAALEANKAQN